MTSLASISIQVLWWKLLLSYIGYSNCFTRKKLLHMQLANRISFHWIWNRAHYMNPKLDSVNRKTPWTRPTSLGIIVQIGGGWGDRWRLWLSVCLSDRALKEKRLELSTPNSVDVQCSAVARRCADPGVNRSKVKITCGQLRPHSTTPTSASSRGSSWGNRACQTCRRESTRGCRCRCRCRCRWMWTSSIAPLARGMHVEQTAWIFARIVSCDAQIAVKAVRKVRLDGSSMLTYVR